MSVTLALRARTNIRWGYLTVRPGDTFRAERGEARRLIESGEAEDPSGLYTTGDPLGLEELGPAAPMEVEVDREEPEAASRSSTAGSDWFTSDELAEAIDALKGGQRYASSIVRMAHHLRGVRNEIREQQAIADAALDNRYRPLVFRDVIEPIALRLFTQNRHVRLLLEADERLRSEAAVTVSA